MRWSICRASSAFTASSAASRPLKPRSENTLPLPRVTRSSAFLSLLGFAFIVCLFEPLLVIPLGTCQSSLDEFDLVLGRFDSTLALFLKHVQHVNRLGESNRVHGAIGVAREILNDLQNAAALEAPQRLGRGMLVARLRKPE